MNPAYFQWLREYIQYQNFNKHSKRQHLQLYGNNLAAFMFFNKKYAN